jgi:hypothetical protein
MSRSTCTVSILRGCARREAPSNATSKLRLVRYVPACRTGRGHCQRERRTRCTAMTVAMGAAEIPPST